MILIAISPPNNIFILSSVNVHVRNLVWNVPVHFLVRAQQSAPKYNKTDVATALLNGLYIRVEGG
jgi:hypothetical protein